nr:type IV pilus modification protein PilV [uncultured Amphritea sp.]
MRRQLGFNLIEVMVALVILSVGMLGMAALQATSIKQNQSAYMRTQANQLAYDIIDRMRVNPEALSSYLQVTSGAANADCLGAAGCDQDEMAGNDLSEWFAAITADLPSGSGLICRSNLVGDVAGTPDCESNTSSNPVVVYIWWDDERDGNLVQLSVSADI